MSIEQGYKDNFRTLLQAIANRDVCLLECKDATTGQTVVAVCAVNHREDGEMSMSPLAKMFDGNPYEELIPPGGESLSVEEEAS